MPPPPRSGLRKGKTQTAARPQPPATKTTAHPLSTRLPTSVGRIKTRGPRQARRRRSVAAAPPHLSSPPAARRRPPVAARSGHIPTRARGRTMILNGAGQRRFVSPREAGSWWRRYTGRHCQMRGRSHGPLIHAPGHRPDDGRAMRGENPFVAGAAGSTALRSHFGTSLEDHGPNVVLYRAGPQTARRAGSLRGHDHSRQSSSSPKPFHRPDAVCRPLVGSAHGRHHRSGPYVADDPSSHTKIIAVRGDA